MVSGRQPCGVNVTVKALTPLETFSLLILT